MPVTPTSSVRGPGCTSGERTGVPVSRCIHTPPRSPKARPFAIVTRQLGLWVLAACRVGSVTDEPDVVGFTYMTLPDHPECGYETFTVRRTHDEVRFDIEATSKAGVLLVQLATPVTRRLQRRATNRYLDALARWTAAAP